jgi:hypothetical protein
MGYRYRSDQGHRATLPTMPSKQVGLGALEARVLDDDRQQVPQGDHPHHLVAFPYG